MHKHGTKPDQPMYQNLTNCAQLDQYLGFFALPDTGAVNSNISKKL